MIFEGSVKDEIVKSSYIPADKFTDFSDISNFDELRKFRLEIFEEIFRQLNTKVTGIDTINEFGGLVLGETLEEPKPIFARIEVPKE